MMSQIPKRRVFKATLKNKIVLFLISLTLDFNQKLFELADYEDTPEWIANVKIKPTG